MARPGIRQTIKNGPRKMDEKLSKEKKKKQLKDKWIVIERKAKATKRRDDKSEETVSFEN